MIYLFTDQRRFCRLALAVACCFPLMTQADLIPTDDNTLYYQLGGEHDMPVPAYDGAVSIPLNVDASLGWGYNCGVFNPKVSITNSLNSIRDSFQAIEQSVITNATSAITELPLYVVARADPSLYNLLNNAFLGARKDIEVATKSCQAMQADLAQGKNPYADWATLSMGNDWRYRMSLASHDNTSFSADSGFSADDNTNNGINNDADKDDINQVNQAVSQDNGNPGVPWVHGVPSSHGGVYAGGLNQPPIAVLHDTSVAGYNVILEAHRAYDDTTAPIKTTANAHLVETWPNPLRAAAWITNVLGDEIITTTNTGKKASTPGVGLLSETQTLTTQITQQINNLVTGQTPLTLHNLKAVSAPGVMVNRAVIAAIQKQPPVMQAIILNKIGEEVATAQVIDKALLAQQILEEGGQVPAIVDNAAAQKMIQQALHRLQADINNVLFNVKVRKALVSNTITQLLTATQTHDIQQSLIQPHRKASPDLSHGAIQAQGN